MIDEVGPKTTQAHWDAAWHLSVRRRLPSRLNVNVRDITNLLRRHAKPGDRYIEIGCAPGKFLAWVAARCKVRAAGLDYSETGISNCKALALALALDIELHQGDFFCHTLPKCSFDVVASFGFIEHFDDRREAVRRHIELLRPGGKALIGVPTYAGLYGRLQRLCDPINLTLHNLNIMNPASLLALVGDAQVSEARAYPYGSVSLWLVNLEKRLPQWLAKAIQLAANALGLLQFFTVPVLAPMLVLEIRK